MTESKNGLDNNWVDPDDAPDLSTAVWQERFSEVSVMHGTRVIRRGRPPSPLPKTRVTLRLDAAVVASLRASGPGWQTRANAILRDWLEQNPD